ncbi:MAG: hypothetical protein HY854_24865 [Burkholderiales bacterium]|nr:hypothetical protein [Burkholderiales bacterium]
MQVRVNVGAGAVLAAAVLVWLAWPPAKAYLVREGHVATSSQPDRDPEVIPTNGGILVIARIKGYETFVRTDSEPLFRLLPIDLGTTISQIRTAALYTYQIKLQEKWPINCNARRCVVRTGPVELAKPVAIYSEETSRHTASGWGRFNKAENLRALESELSARLAVQGNAARNREVGLRDGRKTVQEFVSTWLQKETGRVKEIVVLFPGEQERTDP